MGLRIKLPGILLVVGGVAGIALVAFFREDWGWPEMGALTVVVVVGLFRTLRGG